MKKTDPKKLIKEVRRAMAIPAQSQQELLRRAKKAFGMTNAELGALLDGRSEDTVRSWLATKDAAKHRRMPDDVKRLLTEVLARAKG